MLRVAAFFFAGLIAGAAGVLYVWFNGRISPGHSRASARPSSVLVIAVIGGLRHPIGPFHRRGALCDLEDLRDRYRRRRSLQYLDRR